MVLVTGTVMAFGGGSDGPDSRPTPTDQAKISIRASALAIGL